MEENVEKQKITSVTRYEELEQAKKEVVKAKIHTGICSLGFVVGLVGGVGFPLMAAMTGVLLVRIFKLTDAIKKKAGIEKAIPLEQKHKLEQLGMKK